MAVAVDFDFLQSPDHVIAAGEDHFFPASCPAFQVELVAVSTFHENFHFSAEHVFFLISGNFFMQTKKAVQAVVFDLFGDIVFPAKSWRSFPCAIRVNEGDRVPDLFEPVIGLLEFFFCLSWKADDDIGS